MAENYEGQFTGYQVGPGEGYEDDFPDLPDEGDFGEAVDDEYGYELLERAGVVDEYGDVDPGRLAAFSESLREVHNETVGRAENQALEEAAMELEAEYPALREEAGVWQMVESAATLLDYHGDRGELLEYLAGHPEIIRDAMEY
jgi:hypothetical protein